MISRSKELIKTNNKLLQSNLDIIPTNQIDNSEKMTYENNKTNNDNRIQILMENFQVNPIMKKRVNLKIVRIRRILMN